MHPKKNKSFFIKVFTVGSIIAVLVYLFHPDVGHLNLMIDGQPVADPLVRFAAIPTFLAVLLLTCILAVLLFLGFGMLMFFGCLFIAVMATVIVAPYFWPILAIIVLILALTSYSHGDKEPK